MTDNEPMIGHIYVDSLGRSLIVTGVHTGDPLGREVIGTLGKIKPEGEGPDTRLPYACTLVHWAHRWRDGNPPLDPKKMSI